MPGKNEEVIMKRQVMNGDVHHGRNTLQSRDFDSYDHTTQDIISQFCKINHFLIKNSYIRIGSDKDKSSLSYKCNKEIDVPVLEDGEFYWTNKIMLIINKKYCEIRANINSGKQVEYFGEYS